MLFLIQLLHSKTAQIKHAKRNDSHSILWCKYTMRYLRNKARHTSCGVFLCTTQLTRIYMSLRPNNWSSCSMSTKRHRGLSSSRLIHLIIVIRFKILNEGCWGKPPVFKGKICYVTSLIPWTCIAISKQIWYKKSQSCGDATSYTPNNLSIEPHSGGVIKPSDQTLNWFQ